MVLSVSDLCLPCCASRPDPKQTRYLEIEHVDSESKRGKVNEYRERPVLPSPLQIMQGGFLTGITLRRARTSESTSERHGVVKNFGLGSHRSFGYIILDGNPIDNGSQEVFVHQSKLAPGVKSLEEGLRVKFRLVKGLKGWEAENVEPGVTLYWRQHNGCYRVSHFQFYGVRG